MGRIANSLVYSNVVLSVVILHMNIFLSLMCFACIGWQTYASRWQITALFHIRRSTVLFRTSNSFGIATVSTGCYRFYSYTFGRMQLWLYWANSRQARNRLTSCVNWFEMGYNRIFAQYLSLIFRVLFLIHNTRKTHAYTAFVWTLWLVSGFGNLYI